MLSSARNHSRKVPTLYICLFAQFLRLLFGICVFEVQVPIKGEYVNPVVWGNHPDPSVMALQGGGYLAVSTSNYAFGFRNDAAFPILYSEDLIHWTFKGYAFPGGTWPSWAYMDMWAPELHFINGVFTLYFSGRMKTTRKLAIGVAVAKDLGDLFSGFKDLGYPLLQVATFHFPSCKLSFSITRA